MHEQAQRDPGN